MDFTEMKQKLSDNGIHQLRSGESAQDALDYVDGKIGARKGIQTRVNSIKGRRFDKNEILAQSNKEAFSKFTPAEYNQEVIEDRDEAIEEAEDKREDENKPGFLTNCYYCGCLLYVNDDKNLIDVDYPGEEQEVHCDGCMKGAILCLAM